MRSKHDRKKEWLGYSGLDYSPDQIWLRDNVAALFDLEHPTERQQSVLHAADLHLTGMDLPAGHRLTAELFEIAEQEFGLRPSNARRVT